MHAMDQGHAGALSTRHGSDERQSHRLLAPGVQVCNHASGSSAAARLFTLAAHHDRPDAPELAAEPSFFTPQVANAALLWGVEWSPDGTRLLATTPNSLWTIAAAGSDRRRVAQTNDNTIAHWADDRTIVYETWPR
jgi:hypothetical protein